MDSILGTPRDAVKIPRVPGRETSTHEPTGAVCFCCSWSFSYAKCPVLTLVPTTTTIPILTPRTSCRGGALGPALWVSSRLPTLNTTAGLIFSDTPWWFLRLCPILGFLGDSDGKVLPECRRPGFDPWIGKIPWRRKWKPTPVFLPGEFHGQRNLVGYSPWGHKESDTTEWLRTHTHTRPILIHNLFLMAPHFP